uniref:Putative secreted protein n=1 Tax=Ixodes ricinus TaxID=34613 RepID=A0A6B0U7V4_IXORI
MDTSLTPLLAMKSSALFTLAILWKRILPRSGLGRVSPEITSSSSISFRPLRKSSSMLSIWVPALRRCELHHAVNVLRCCFSHAGSSSPSRSHSSSCSM